MRYARSPPLSNTPCRRELDPSALVIRALERVGLAWDVVRVSPERQASKLVALPAR